MSSEKPKAKRPGRPPVAGRTLAPGKSAPLFVTTSPEVRAAVEQRATTTGGTLSQVAERLMRKSLAGEADLENLLGGVAAAPLIRRLIAFARVIQSEVGDPASDDRARAAFAEGAIELIRRAPAGTDATELQLIRARQRAAIRAACAEYVLFIDAHVEHMPGSDRSFVAACADKTGAFDDAELEELASLSSVLPGIAPQALKQLAANIADLVVRHADTMRAAERDADEARRRGREIAAALLEERPGPQVRFTVRDGEVLTILSAAFVDGSEQG